MTTMTYGWEQHVVAPTQLRRLAHRMLGTYDLGARVRYHAVEQALNGLAAPVSILDAGCGRGQLCFAMYRRWPNARIAGVDFEAELVTHCRAVQARVAPASAMRFERRTLPEDLGETFDLITSVDVLEHVEDDLGFLTTLFHATNPNGTLVLHTPAAPQRRFIAEFEEQHDHVRDGYGLGELAALLHRAGYAQVRVRHTFGTLGALGWEGFSLARQGNRVAQSMLPVWYLLSTADGWSEPRRGNGLLAVARRA
ncbi:methyltransferase domain-containing protein [bacterium]|nr:MAG: methyltransferase domain-containing protein [bacterium]